jgi:exonuclease SbcD
MTRRAPVRLLHTSDVHVAGDEPSIAGLRSVVDTALERAVDVVLIAGDLFDSARVPDPAVEETLEQLARLTMPVVVIPGNHDCVDQGSIYRRVDLSRAGHHVHFAGDPAGQRIVFEDLSLAVWARGIEDHHPGHFPLSGYTPAGPGLWNVVVTHGHYATTPDDAHRSSRITQEEISALDCDYLALGHWHRFVEVSQGGVKAAYSGSPSESRSAALVRLDPDAGVQVEKLDLTHP